MCASKADRPVSLVTDSEDQAISGAIDIPVGAISMFAVIETVVPDDSEIIEISPACERYAML
jgi:hypothetical protein